MVVADSRARRDGRFVEIIGTYDPKNKDPMKQVNLRLDRADYWLGVGAQPSDTARTVINRAKRENPNWKEEAEAAAAASAPSEPTSDEDVLVGDDDQVVGVEEVSAEEAPAEEEAPTAEPVAEEEEKA